MKSESLKLYIPDKQVCSMETSVSMLSPYPLSMCCYAECGQGGLNRQAHNLIFGMGPKTVFDCLLNSTYPHSAKQHMGEDRGISVILLVSTLQIRSSGTVGLIKCICNQKLFCDV